MASVFRQLPDDTIAFYESEGDEALALFQDVVGEQASVVVAEFYEVVYELSVNDATHAQSVDNLTLTIVETLSVQDAIHEQSAENVTLISQTFAVANATHALASDNVALEQVIYKPIDVIVVACEQVSGVQVVTPVIASMTMVISQITETTGVLVEVSERTHVSTHIEVKAEYE